MSRLLFARALCGGALAVSLICPAAETSSGIDFNKEIRPILSENCFSCHGPDKNKRKAGLRLDKKEDATAKLESGDAAIVPGDPAKSKMLALLTTANEDDRMPPAKKAKRLEPAQIELLTRWIKEGAPWKGHWAYIPPVRPALPEVQNKNWPRNEIDYFILARLEKEGLQPAPEAGKCALARRLSLDLTGLPPTVGEVDALLADNSPGAYENLVDRLLESPHYGERMAQNWLDLARYADSDGYHADAPRSMWQYRDWVINAFNSNMPFDQFTIEQLAGDLLPNPTLAQRVATAFNRNGMSSTEGGADPDEYMAKYVTDRVNTTSTVWLGSTLACAECHDHKYDPFTQKEYYQLFDFFNRIPEKGLDSDPAPPFAKVPSAEQQAELTQFAAQIKSLETQRQTALARPDEKLDRGQKEWEERQRQIAGGDWKVLEPTGLKSSGGASFTLREDKSVLLGGTNADTDTLEFAVQADAAEVTGFKLETLPDDSLPLKGSGRAENGRFILTGAEIQAESLAADASAAEAPVLGDWRALGPFKAANVNEAFDKAFIAEMAVDLKKTYDDGKLKWVEKPEWKDGVIQALTGDNSATYIYRTITVKTPRLLKISLGSDDGLAVWHNGKRRLARNISRGAAPDQEILYLPLEKGENTFLMKVVNGAGAYAFYFKADPEPVKQYPVTLASALADSEEKDFPASAVLDDKPATGWSPGAGDKKHQAIFLPTQTVAFPGGTRLKVRLKFEAAAKQQVAGRFRFSVSSGKKLPNFAPLPSAAQSAFFADAASLTAGQKQMLAEYYREKYSPEVQDLVKKLATARQSEKDLQARIPTIRVMEEMAQPRATQVLVRGDYRNRGDRVYADVPKALPPLPAGSVTNRLALAKWLVDPKHPLVSRVVVNRYWQLYFGTGIVKTGNEFGSQGELPSHPELLDWLATEFIASGWNIKAMQKKIVMSATYRQSSKGSEKATAQDPGNRLLARGPRFRLPAEVIRDSALAYSGLLDRNRKPGGPSVRPYQPEGLWEEMMFGGNKYEVGKGDELYRRSIYTLWKRTVPYPTFKTFDAPDRAICTEQRGMTCTPLQAFVTLNEKTFVEAARVFAQRVLAEGGRDTQERLDFAFKTVLARTPDARERALITKIYDDMLDTYSHDLKSALELISVGESKRPAGVNEMQLVAWTTVANLLFNLDETISKE